MSIKLSRREFLEVAGKGGAGVFIGNLVDSSPMAPGPLYGSFTKHEAQTLLAAAEAIIPTRKGEPTVVDVNVLGYIDREIFDTPERGLVSKGLAGLDQTSRLMFGADKNFVGLPSSQRIAALKALEAGDAPGDAWNEIPPVVFFRTMRGRIVEGYFSNPLVWKSIGFGGRSQFVGYPDYHHWPQK